jgi:uncharacterized integral membrane protein
MALHILLVAVVLLFDRMANNTTSVKLHFCFGIFVFELSLSGSLSWWRMSFVFGIQSLVS